MNNKDRIQLLERLVSDCISYNLSETEALQYLEKTYKQPVSKRNYYIYKKRLETDESTNLWLNQFTKIGFVANHRMLVEDAQKVYKDSLKRYFTESIRNSDKHLIMRLEYNIRENGRYLTELIEGTPIIAAIKSQLTKQNEPIPEEQKENGIREDNQESTTPVNRNGWV